MNTNQSSRTVNTNPINCLCMISDDNYAIFTGIALTSLKHNKDASSFYKVYILSDNICEENKKRLLSLQDNSLIITIIEASGFEDIKKDMEIKGIPATPTALYKFLIPSLLNDLDKVLYVDGDVLFYKDISSLFDFDLNEYYAVVTPENLPSDEIPFSSKRIGINHSIYFNSGLMLMNLKMFREDNISDKLLNYRINGINYLMDQDAFNAVIGKNVSYFPTYYFTLCYELEKDYNYKKYYEKDRESIIQKTIIMHLAYKKPWKVKMPYFTEQYLYYHKLSPFRDIKLKPTPYFIQTIKKINRKIYLNIYKKKIYQFIKDAKIYHMFKKNVDNK